jgi:hypothetical protein
MKKYTKVKGEGYSVDDDVNEILIKILKGDC